LILLGLDPLDTGTLAVFVDENGHVLSRTTYPERQPAAAAGAATHDGKRPDAVGITHYDDASDPVFLGGLSGRIAVVNPGAALALSEQWIGAAKGARHVIGVMTGKGMHAGIVIDGRVFGGAHGLAGAIRWLALNPVEREDYRRLGCLDAEVGEPGIVRRIVWRIKSGDRSNLQDLVNGNLNAITARQIFEAARADDGVAVSVVRDTARYIGMAIANLVTILDPEVIVVGGLVAEAADLLLEPSRLEMMRRVSPTAGQQVSVVPASLGAEGAAIGAARAAFLATAG
jgi:predicted NBD/HSP70 family sugar kinase